MLRGGPGRFPLVFILPRSVEGPPLDCLADEPLQLPVLLDPGTQHGEHVLLHVTHAASPFPLSPLPL